MIGTIQVKISAHSPQMPLCPVFAFQDSCQNVRICDVPRKIGDWSIKRVEVECQFPDNTTTSYECVLVGGVWTTTIESCPTAGTTKNGFAVNGYDESGNKYILGKSDLYILTNDSRVIPQKELTVVNILPSKPQTPHVGDAVFVYGKLEVYDGANWISTGMDDGVIEGIEQEIAGVDAKIAEVSHKVTSEDGTQYINGEGEIWKKENGYTPWVARYVGYDPDPQANIHWAGNDETGDGMWILLVNGVQQLTNPNPISTDKTATHLEFKHNDDGQWYDMVADRTAVEGQWTKKDDLATQSYVDNAIGQVLTQEEF